MCRVRAESVRAEALRLLEQRGADAAAVRVRLDVERVEFVAVQDEEAEQPAVVVAWGGRATSPFG